MSQNCCLSGGAQGADYEWGKAAITAGHDLMHFNFSGHKSADPDHTITLKQTDLDTATSFLERANKSLERRLPFKKPFVFNLLKRNYFQVCSTERVYAISSIFSGKVEGGTAWATQMYIDMLQNDEYMHDYSTYGCYVFCQRKNVWFSWTPNEWTVIDAPPKPHGVWTGIGSRKLTDQGRLAITSLFE